MSRTRHGSKAPGTEYWGRRLGPKCATPGRYSKFRTHRAERIADHAAEADMSDSSDDSDEREVSVFDLVQWTGTLGAEPLPLVAVHALRLDVDAGRVVLTDREKQLFATLGLIIGHAAHDHARRMFEREAPTILASLVARMGGGDDDPTGGGGSVQ